MNAFLDMEPNDIQMLDSFNFEWHQYEEHVKHMMKTLWSSNKYADVTLITDDDFEIKSHRIVLSSCSKVFDEMFSSSDAIEPIVKLNGLCYQSLRPMIDFMYLGKVQLCKENVENFLNTAKILLITELCDNLQLDAKDVKHNFTIYDSNQHDVPQSEVKTDAVPQFQGDKGNSESFINSQYRHIKLIHFGKKVCKICDKKFSQTFALYTHLKDIHLKKEHICYHCGTKFQSNSSLWKHVKFDHAGIKFDCKICPFEAKNLIELKSHMKQKHSMIEYETIYSFVTKEPESVLDTKNTNSTENEAELDEISCPACNFKSRSATKYAEHLRKIHSLRDKCNICGKQITRAHDLCRHLKYVHMKKRYNCKKCDKVYQTNSNLKRHVKVEHLGLRIRCNSCTFETKDKRNMQNHLLQNIQCML